MAFNEREIVRKALDRAAEEFFRIFTDLTEQYPDVARRGVQALLLPQVGAAEDRKIRETFASVQDPEEFLRLLETAIAGRSEQEVFDSLTPRRQVRPDEEGIDAYGPRL